MIVLTELVGAAWDIYSWTSSGEAMWAAMITLAVHAVIIVGAWPAWTASHREMAPERR